MKLSFLSKSISAIGLMAALSVVVGPSIAKSVQAQTEPRNFTEEEALANSAACDRATKENSEATPDGDYLYDTLRFMNATDQQRNAYNTLSEQSDDRRAEIYPQSVSVPDLSSYLGFMYSPEALGIDLENSQDMQADIDAAVAAQVPPEIQAAIREAMESGPRMDQEAALNEQFGEYGGYFYGSYFTYYTPEQDAQLQQITRDFHTQVEALLTPEQQTQYRENLAAGERIRAACEWEGPISAYPASGRISETVPEGMITETRGVY
jgi:hypothetical protein